MSAPKGNNYNLKYTLAESINIFKKIIKYTIENKCLSIQEAIIDSNIIPYSSYYYIMDKYKQDLECFKKELESVIIAVVNRGAILGTYNATASIWRQKQLGEVDRTEVEQKGSVVEKVRYIEVKDKKAMEKHIEEFIEG